MSIQKSVETIVLYSEQDMREAHMAGCRRGYSNRSIMAGAKGTNEPEWDEWIKEYKKSK